MWTIFAIMNALNIFQELLVLNTYVFLKLYNDDWLTSMKTDKWECKMEKIILKLAQ